LADRSFSNTSLAKSLSTLSGRLTRRHFAAQELAADKRGNRKTGDQGAVEIKKRGGRATSELAADKRGNRKTGDQGAVEIKKRGGRATSSGSIDIRRHVPESCHDSKFHSGSVAFFIVLM
jgi:hypothetical protein